MVVAMMMIAERILKIVSRSSSFTVFSIHG